jgi:hypothetical protein
VDIEERIVQLGLQFLSVCIEMVVVVLYSFGYTIMHERERERERGFLEELEVGLREDA